MTLLLPSFTPARFTSIDAALDRVYCCDALDLLRALPDASVDAVITDPPYNLTELDFEQAIDWQSFWSEVRRVSTSRATPCIVFSQQPFTTDLIMSNRTGWRDEIVWEKSMPVGFLNANSRPLECHELIEIFADKKTEYYPQMERTNASGHTSVKRTASKHYGAQKVTTYKDNGTRYPRSVWKFAQRDSAFHNTVTLHPTQKPLPLLERLIQTYTLPNAIIVDPFMGSGTTATAARNLGRYYIGCDLSPDYVALANKRLAQPYTLPMFAAVDVDEAKA